MDTDTTNFLIRTRAKPGPSWLQLRKRWVGYWRTWQRTVYERAGAEGVVLEGELWRAAMVINLMWRPVWTCDYLWMRFKLRCPLPGDRFEDFQADLTFRVVGVDPDGVYCEVRSGYYCARYGDDWDAPLPAGAVRDYRTVPWDDMGRMLAT